MRNLLYYFLHAVDKSGLRLDFAGSSRCLITINIKIRKKHMNNICGENNTLRKKLQSESESNEWVVENGLTIPDRVTLHIKRLLALFFLVLP